MGSGDVAFHMFLLVTRKFVFKVYFKHKFCLRFVSLWEKIKDKKASQK